MQSTITDNANTEIKFNNEIEAKTIRSNSKILIPPGNKTKKSKVVSPIYTIRQHNLFSKSHSNIFKFF